MPTIPLVQHHFYPEQIGGSVYGRVKAETASTVAEHPSSSYPFCSRKVARTKKIVQKISTRDLEYIQLMARQHELGVENSEREDALPVGDPEDDRAFDFRGCLFTIGIDCTNEEFDEAEPSKHQEAEAPMWVSPPSELTKRHLQNLDKKGLLGDVHVFLSFEGQLLNDPGKGMCTWPYTHAKHGVLLPHHSYFVKFVDYYKISQRSSC
uniref:Uncharacterized protein n=1 Tax=Cannabis sativa TaxID=3483 RepID=A0A803NNH8_CANSA